MKDFETGIAETNERTKIKTLIDFNENNWNSIKFLGVKNNINVKVMNFMNSKCLYLQNYLWQVLFITLLIFFCFPPKYVKDIFFQKKTL